VQQAPLLLTMFVPPVVPVEPLVVVPPEFVVPPEPAEPELLVEPVVTGTAVLSPSNHQPGGHTKPQPIGGGGVGAVAPASGGVGEQSLGSVRLQHWNAFGYVVHEGPLAVQARKGSTVHSPHADVTPAAASQQMFGWAKPAGHAPDAELFELLIAAVAAAGSTDLSASDVLPSDTV
jgi:hypothetical protein